MSKKIDVRGLSCPRPVIMARKAIGDKKFPIEILADTAVSCENIKRLAEKEGCNVQVEPVEDEFKIILSLLMIITNKKAETFQPGYF